MDWSFACLIACFCFLDVPSWPCRILVIKPCGFLCLLQVVFLELCSSRVAVLTLQNLKVCILFLFFYVHKCAKCGKIFYSYKISAFFSSILDELRVWKIKYQMAEYLSGLLVFTEGWTSQTQAHIPRWFKPFSFQLMNSFFFLLHKGENNHLFR